MFCPTCGVALSQHLQYCNRCGAQLTIAEQPIVKKSEKRLDSYLDGLFWITVFGLVFTFGGITLMHRLQLPLGLIIAYAALSSVAFLLNFGLNLREILRLSRASKEPKNTARLAEVSRGELGPMDAQVFLEATPSITENTTRQLESIQNEKMRR